MPTARQLEARRYRTAGLTDAQIAKRMNVGRARAGQLAQGADHFPTVTVARQADGSLTVTADIDVKTLATRVQLALERTGVEVQS